MDVLLGTRINHGNHLGTVRYIGPVDNTSGTWLGIEWDDPARGKHDGSKDGKQYFTCRFKMAGSFIRPTAHIIYGISFIEALFAKYIEALHGSETQEKVILGSSQGAIEVEAVSLDKIRAKFSRLDRLREVSLENANVARGDPGTIRTTCPSIQGLDLSFNLLPSWETVAGITQELPSLRRLALNGNRLQLPVNNNSMEGAFSGVTEIQLNATLLTWTEMQAVTSMMPTLQVIEMGYNHLTRLSDGVSVSNSAVQTINLDSNCCSDWAHVCASFKEYHSLQRIVLTSNRFDGIPFPNRSADQLPGVRHISLSDNQLRAWSDVDALSCWFPALETLAISGNPLVNDTELGNQSRPFIIARIPSLLTLDGAAISSKEREDSELFYMSTIVQQEFASDDSRQKAHYRWHDLCAKHGKPDNATAPHKSQDKLSTRLIELHKHSQATDQTQLAIGNTPTATIRVLPTMTLRNLRLKACKALKFDTRRTALKCWLRMHDATLTELDSQYDTRNLDWLGIENGSQIVYQETH
ncbi:hypothetical protein B0H34DRAFT_649985 [Crassisporium funariophilum]|nr:hypothetical protein B0H34DRAFT_649985 [Crassisporium funariophilum]